MTIMKELLGLRPSAPIISQYINSLAEAAKIPKGTTPGPEIKSYSDAVYFNYYPLGISLVFVPTDGYKPKTGLELDHLQQEKLVLDSIDIYNVPKTPVTDTDESKSSRSELVFTTFPVSPIVLPITAQPKDQDGKIIERRPQLDITLESSGKDFVGALGEPDRKGGGTGPSSGSINIWCEWSKDGLMVEFGGAQSKGPRAWDTGKDATWKVITIFRPVKRD
ncbi:hypothetical protein D9756_004087 [Leucocoprinus leucothites]|uniref:Uncharacterized protein n=1 Tax=Leucocoprinus leucothites TaxID=201217 RepID=A0A8H5D938_9AGAR|nr:hypothetical protein D9756_004087 [Leucoagaricus leucothites]